jgi:hypothetical protein
MPKCETRLEPVLSENNRFISVLRKLHFLSLQFLCQAYIIVFLLVISATDPKARVRFPELPEKILVGLERGPLSLVSTNEELLNRKVGAPV